MTNRNQNPLAAAQDQVQLSVAGGSAVGFQLTGTFVGTVTFEGTVDGVNWVSLAVQALAETGTTHVTTATAPGIWTSNVGGLLLVRARMSAYTSGTSTATLQAAESAGGIR